MIKKIRILFIWHNPGNVAVQTNMHELHDGDEGGSNRLPCVVLLKLKQKLQV